MNQGFKVKVALFLMWHATHIEYKYTKCLYIIKIYMVLIICYGN